MVRHQQTAEVYDPRSLSFFTPLFYFRIYWKKRNRFILFKFYIEMMEKQKNLYKSYKQLSSHESLLLNAVDPFVLLSHRLVKRQTKWKQLSEETRTMVFLESPHRLIKFLEEVIEYFGANRKVCVCRELTKMFEEVVAGTPKEVFWAISNSKNRQKGEFVVIIDIERKK